VSIEYPFINYTVCMSGRGGGGGGSRTGMRVKIRLCTSPRECFY
jgi:hypothetical protein